MVYRETPRIAAKDGRLDGVIDDADSRPRLRRFDFVRAERQLDLPRVLLASCLFLAGVALIGYLGTQALRTMIRWLHQQPQYQVKFLDIRLQDEPPAWFRGGSQAFLRQVRENAKEAEVLPVLELETERIDRDFKLFPWVDDVTRVEYPPQGITVHLVYKQPVATIPFPPGEHVILDRNSHILPVKDIDTEKLGPLIRITGTGLDQPAADNRPGRAWRSSAPARRGPHGWNAASWELQGLPGFSRKLIEPAKPRRYGTPRPDYRRDRSPWLVHSERRGRDDLLGRGARIGSQRKPRGEGKMGDAEKMGVDPVPSHSSIRRLLDVFANGAQAGGNSASALMHPGSVGSNSRRDIGATCTSY